MLLIFHNTFNSWLSLDTTKKSSKMKRKKHIRLSSTILPQEREGEGQKISINWKDFFTSAVTDSEKRRKCSDWLSGDWLSMNKGSRTLTCHLTSWLQSDTWPVAGCKTATRLRKSDRDSWHWICIIYCKIFHTFLTVFICFAGLSGHLMGSLTNIIWLLYVTLPGVTSIRSTTATSE